MSTLERYFLKQKLDQQADKVAKELQKIYPEIVLDALQDKLNSICAEIVEIEKELEEEDDD